MTAIQEIVDAMLDEAHTAHPGFEFSIAMTDENTLLLPKHADFLEREVDGVEGAYRSHVYRDCIVWSQRVPDWMIIITPVKGYIPEADAVPTYYGDVRTGEFHAGYRPEPRDGAPTAG